MVPECSYRYPDGRNCRRIPRRGESLCRDHRRQIAARLRKDAAEQAFLQQTNEAADEIIRLPLNRMLDDAQQALMTLEAFIEASVPAPERLCFMRAMTAVTAAIDCVDSQPRVLSEAVPGLTRDDVNAMMLLLWYARPNYAAQAQRIADCDRASPETTACISK